MEAGKIIGLHKVRPEEVLRDASEQTWSTIVIAGVIEGEPRIIRYFATSEPVDHIVGVLEVAKWQLMSDWCPE